MENGTTAVLARQASLHLAQVYKVATKPSRLKGTFKKYLKDAATAMRTIVEVLVGRSSSEEVRKQERANQRLQEHSRKLQEEVQELREHQVNAYLGAAPPSRMDAARVSTRACPAADDDDTALAERLGRVRMEVDEQPPPPSPVALTRASQACRAG